jgi:hypothetical protein
VLFRSPRWQMEEEFRADYFDESMPKSFQSEVGVSIPGEVEIDVAYCDPRHVEGDAADRLLAVEGSNGRDARPISSLLLKLPLYSVVARRYRRR